MHANIGLIDTPGFVGWLEMTAQPLFQFGTVALDPAPDRRVVGLQAAFGEQLFDIAERERVPQIPAHGAKNQLRLRLSPLEDRRSDCLLHDLSGYQPQTAKVATHPFRARYCWSQTPGLLLLRGRVTAVVFPRKRAYWLAAGRRIPTSDTTELGAGSVLVRMQPTRVLLAVIAEHPEAVEDVLGRQARNSSSKNLAAVEKLDGRAVSSFWAILGNAQRQRWHFWHSRQRGICNLQILRGPQGFESHPHRH